MERLVKNRYGQWSLVKSWGSPVYTHIAHPNSPFTNKTDAQKAKIDYIKRLKTQEFARYENRKNIQTNKDELHVLLHRGINDEAGDIQPNGKGPNKVDWSNNKTIKTTHNSIHTAHPDEARGHAETYDKIGVAHSFWVPISSIHGNGEFIDKHFKHPEPGDEMHALIAPGEYQIHDSYSLTNSGKKTPEGWRIHKKTKRI